MKFKKIVALATAALMLLSVLPISAFAANDYTINSTVSTDDYYNLISKTDWDIAPGITESQIVLDNDEGSRRQVLFVMEADLNNEYVKVINSYNGMVPEYGSYKTGVMSEQAAYAEANGYGNVVGAMNTTLSWYSGYSADRVGEPLGFIMLDAEVLFDPANCGYEYGKVGFPSVVVINKDVDENGNPRPDDIPKVEMPQITSAADLDGWEDQVIPVSSGYIVKDGVNQYSADHTSSSAPRSVVGIKPDGTVVIMLNDGRQEPYSAGMTMYELAEVMLDLGCSFAVNCDGGGSSTYLSQRPGEELKVNNSPSDGAERETTTGILFISTAPATGEFVRANISSEYDYYTPNSVVEFTAIGTDLVGTEADIPAEASWQLADASFGTIENGVFTSNGKEGVVTAQLVYNGAVVGEDTINIVMPDEITFAQNNMVIPFGKDVEIKISATYDSKPVCIKVSDVTFALSNPVLGTLNGFVFTSAPEGTEAEPGTLTATIGELTITANIALGKGTEIAYDFEDQNIADWTIATNYPQYGPKGPNGAVKDADGNYWYNGQNELGYLSIVDSTTGKVRNGQYALAMECDFTQIYETGFHSLNMRFPKVDTTDAVAVGFWIYVPFDARHSDLTINTVLGSKFFADGSAFDLCEGWHYLTIDAPAAADGFYGISISVDERASGKDANGNNYYDNVTTPNLNGKYTFYIDDISVDYSTAVEDRENPVFADVMVMDAVGSVNATASGQTISFNNPTFEVKVTDFVADNATDINAASAKAYIDGKEVTTAFANGKMTVNGLALADGVHTVKFEIADNAGNSAWVGGSVAVNAGTDMPTVKVVPQDPDADRLLVGSLYWMDIVATDIEKVQKIETTFDMNNASYWELDGLTLAKGFEAEWSVQEDDNIATITITRTGTVDATGEAAIASFPVRTWESHITEYPGYENQTPAVLVSRGIIWAQSIELALEKGIVTYTDNTVDTFGMKDILVDTELFFTNYTRKSVDGAQAWIDACTAANVGFHEHTVVALDNKAPTCTEDGYTDRTFCEVCNSVVDWGTIEEAKGHDYQFVEGVLTCACGDLFNGEYTDGKTYVDGVEFINGWLDDTYYFVDGVKVTGQYLIDGTMCTFDENGVYQPDYSFTGFYHDGIGWTYYMANFQKKGFVVIDGNTHYFDDNTGYAPIGSFTLAEDRVYKVEGEQGKVIGGWDTFIVDGVERRRYYYSLRYYKNQWLEVDGDMYYFNNDGYALIGKRAVAFSGEYLGGYEFADDGKLIGAITGPFVDAESGYMYFAEDGVMACNKLVKYENDYYFARNNYLLITWGTYISEEQANGLLPAGEYQFGADGKLVMINGPVADPYNSAYLNFYQNGARVYEEGLYEFEGDYYYVRPNGLLLTWAAYISEEKANGLLPAGEYKFGADGKLLMLNGPVQDAYNATYLNFYIDGIRVYDEGLYEYDGDYYYVRSNGLLLTWAAYVSEEMANGLLPAGEYKFGADGKLQMLNGPVEDAYNATYLNFYIDGIRVYDEGLYEYDGDYYYVRSNGLLLTWAAYVSEEMANGLLPAGEYKFGADGKLQMLNGPVQDAYNAAYLNFYIDGIRVYEEGLYEYEGDYYYVRSNGLLLTWASYISEEYANGLLPAGEYKFGADGKLQMLNGPVADAYNPAYLTFYVNGIRVYEEGLYEYEGDYYYVRSNGLLLTWGQYISEEKTNGLLPAGDYTFGEDGKMIVE